MRELIRIGAAAGLVLLSACGNSNTNNNGSGSGGAAQHALHVHVAGNGVVSAATPALSCRSDCQQSVDSATTVHLAAVPDAGWNFAGWQGACSGTGSCDLPMTADRDVTASFTTAPPTPPGSARLSVSPVGNGTGRVTSSPAGIDCPAASCSMVVPLGSVVTLTEVPDASSTFAGWGGGCSANGGCSVTAQSDVTVWVNFVANTPPPPPPPPPGPPPQCAGISAPDAVSMQQYVRPKGSVTCAPGLGDTNGTLAFTGGLQSSTAHGSILDFVRDNGTFLVEQSSQSQSLRPFQQPNGVYSAGDAGHLGPNNTVRMGRWDANGTWQGDLLWHAQNFAPAGNPNGGLLLAGDLTQFGIGQTTPPYQHAAMMFRVLPSDAPAWGPQTLASAGAVFGAGVDLLGRSIVITDGGAKFGSGAISAQWFDKDGTPLTGEFVLVTAFVSGASTWFETSPLIGGGVGVRRMDADYATATTPYRVHARALVMIASGASAVQPPPDWMNARPDTRLQLTRGGRAYAALPYGAPTVACTQKLEVLASDGTSCGSTDYPIAAGNCNTSDLTLAENGTVMQQLPFSMEYVDPVDSMHTCTWRWWARAAH